MTSTARRRLPGHCIVTSPDISVLALSRSSDAQWSAIERVAAAAARLLTLRAPDREGAVAFCVELADGVHHRLRPRLPALLIGPVVEAWDRDEVAAAGMGALPAVARGGTRSRS